MDRESGFRIYDKISEAIGFLNGSRRAMLEKDVALAQDLNHKALRVCMELGDLFYEETGRD